MSDKTSIATRFKLYSFLNEVIERVTGDEDNPGTCRFKDDWNDAKISEKFGVSRYVARYARASLFGELEERPRKTSKPLPELEVIEQRLDQLQACLRNLNSQFNMLCTKLGEDGLKVRHQIHVED